jgi:beta-N-acetylhexosaminidase
MDNSTDILGAVLKKFLLGFAGTALPRDLIELLGAGLTGVTIFRRNFRNPEELLRLTDEIRDAAGGPVLIGIDQEGGVKFALPEPFTQWPTAAELGELNDAEAVESVARAMACEVLAAGCNLIFAPMLDLHLRTGSPVTTERSFGSDPQRVGELGAAFVRGLAAEGILGCAKHFPGHGDAEADPHLDLPIFEGTLERLREMELAPFAEAMRAGVPTVMTAHILLPWIDPSRPATLSRRVIENLLRQELNFKGVVLADDLGMGAIAKKFPAGAAAVECFRAGCDIAMLCHGWGLVMPALAATGRALERGELGGAAWKASQTRIDKLLGRRSKAHAKRPSLGVIGCAEHHALARELRARIKRSRLIPKHLAEEPANDLGPLV